MKYNKKDCRNNGGPIVGKPMTYRVLGKEQGYPEANPGPNRHERRTVKHFAGVRKNTRGVPIGFNKKTWVARCADLATTERKIDACAE